MIVTSSPSTYNHFKAQGIFTHLVFNSLVSILLLSVFFFNNQALAQKSIFDTSSQTLEFKSLSNDKAFLKVEEAFVIDITQDDNQLNVIFDIAPGYYLYRHQFKFSGDNSSFSDVALPEGKDHEDEFFGVQQVYRDQLHFSVNIEQAKSASNFTLRYQGCADKGLCYPPKKHTIELDEVAPKSEKSANDDIVEAITKNDSSTSAQTSEQHLLADMLKQDDLWVTLVAFFAGGLLLSLTPCVFPMYPILTGIIVGQGKSLTTSKAFTLSFFYVQGMAITYTILGVVVALAGAQFQAAFQHPAVLIVLSVLFIFLALSMFGVFNLSLPSSWQNKLNDLSNSQKGGSVVGVILMGVISGLVASPCTTAPLTGALLYISQTGDILLGASALYALSLGMGLPLLILGSSGGKLLPKAGAWMNIIKNIFGLLLLAVPIFLLERLIPAIATQLLWSALILASAMYFYVENQNASTSKKGLFYALRSFVIFAMMFYGGLMAYQSIYPTTLLNVGSTQQTSPKEASGHSFKFEYVKSLAELNERVALANANGKTVMVDLYADWCIACKEFEKYTFTQTNVQAALSNSVWIQIDLTNTGSKESKELMKYYNVFGLPSILFFDLSGKELQKQRVTGFMNDEQFTNHIKTFF
jgi:thiol:disulfide interchange protein DsbD